MFMFRSSMEMKSTLGLSAARRKVAAQQRHNIAPHARNINHHSSTPEDWHQKIGLDRSRTDTPVRAQDFESSASASSATRPRRRIVAATRRKKSLAGPARGRRPDSLRHPTRRHMPRLALLLFQRRNLVGALAQHANA